MNKNIKTYALSLLLFFISLSRAEAQFVTLPDTNFRNFLKIEYPSCFNTSGQLDTNCAKNDNKVSLEIPDSTVVNIEGIRYFKKLRGIGYVSRQSILPTLPDSLRFLYTIGGQLTGFTSFPSKLLDLICPLNNITSLPPLPNTLKVLDCQGNQLTQLPTLPPQLNEIWINANLLTSIPNIPEGITGLNAEFNELQSLPTLPSNMRALYVEYNKLTQLPALPPRLKILSVGYNRLRSLPELPDSLEELDCRGNYELACLPYLKKALTALFIDSAAFTCLPNRPANVTIEFGSFLYNMPICNPTSAAYRSECPNYPKIIGYVFHDQNSNGLKDAGEIPYVGAKIHLASEGIFSYTDANGFYEIVVDTVGAFVVTIDTSATPSFFIFGQISHTATLASFGQTIEKNFPYTIDVSAPIKDFRIALTNLTAFARPGFPLHFQLKYENIGPIAGNAQVKFAHAALYSADSSSVANSFSGDTLVWNFSNVPTGFTGYINVYGRLSANTVLGSTQDFYASVNFNDVEDVNLANNSTRLQLVVRGSYDPNDKQGPATITPTQLSNGKYLDYTVRFQNTGTDTAFTVVITDTLANNLQANTLEMISASHNVRTSLKGNIIYFEFLNILLPDSNVNEPRSHGFVKFRIKPKNTLVLGNTVQNKAAIYFDYNAPVITNTVTTTVAIPTGIAEKITNRLEVFPNPLEGEMLNIPNVRGASAKLLTLTGQELRSWTNIGEQISLQNVAAGMYLLEVSQNGQRRTAKVVVK